MDSKTIPTVILGGCDSQPAALPERGRDKHALRGYKAVDIRIAGQPMIRTVIDRLRESGAFGPVFVAGPASVYAPHDLPAELIDTDSTFGGNIRVAVEALIGRFPNTPVAFTTCDILPDVRTLRGLAARFRAETPCDMWCPLIRRPQDRQRLGASDWKPAYRIIPEGETDPVATLPGHLVIADLQAMRLEFIYSLFQIGYRTRNRSIRYRSLVMLRGLLGELLKQDVLHVLGLRLPTLTYDVLGWGLPTGRKLRLGTATQADVEHALRRLFVTRAHRLRHPERRTRIPIVDGLSMAIDLDTEEEAREQGAVVGRTGSAR